MEWSGVLTKTQEEKLVRDTVAALKKLISFPADDLLRNIYIAVMGQSDRFHLVLTPKGLFEEFHCGGHKYPNMFDEYDVEHCSQQPPKEIKEEHFEQVVKAYKLTPTQIEEVLAKLN